MGRGGHLLEGGCTQGQAPSASPSWLQDVGLSLLVGWSWDEGQSPAL